MKGAVKDGVGSVTGNERLEREGERENQEGRARQASNDAVDAPGTPRTWDSKWSREHLVTGLYDSPDTARKAYDNLTTRHGYKDDDISVVMTDETRTRHFGDAKPGTEFKEGTKAAEGAGIGGGIGLGVGAALGAIVAAATAIAIPGLGLVVAGPIAGAIAGAGAGSATGTLSRRADRGGHSRDPRGRVRTWAEGGRHRPRHARSRRGPRDRAGAGLHQPRRAQHPALGASARHPVASARGRKPRDIPPYCGARCAPNGWPVSGLARRRRLPFERVQRRHDQHHPIHPHPVARERAQERGTRPASVGAVNLMVSDSPRCTSRVACSTSGLSGM